MFPRPPSVTVVRSPLLPVLALCTLAVPLSAGAQARVPVRDSVAGIPRSMVPPAGKCRIWMEGVPASQQPAPTDCTTALRQKPANGVLVFGPAKRDLSPFDARQQTPAARGTDDARRPGGTRADTMVPRAPQQARPQQTQPSRGGGVVPSRLPMPARGRDEAGARSAPPGRTETAPPRTGSPADRREPPPPPPPTKKPERP